MPSTEGYPFRRLAVDHMIIGVSRIWWELDRQFRDPMPYTFQLQAGNTGNPNATDWVNVGTAGVNTYFAEDDERREGNYGKSLLTHYRVVLTTGNGHKYVSLPVHTYGELQEKDWVFAREIVRKERLRHRLVSVEGFLLKRINYRYITQNGVGIDDAVVNLYLASDFNAGNRGTNFVKASSRTDIDGRWVRPVMLDPASYVVYFYKQNAFGPDTAPLTVT